MSDVRQELTYRKAELTSNHSLIYFMLNRAFAAMPRYQPPVNLFHSTKNVLALSLNHPTVISELCTKKIAAIATQNMKRASVA